MATIRNPIEWVASQLGPSAEYLESAAIALGGKEITQSSLRPQVRAIGIADLRAVLLTGIEDFKAFRSDVIFLCILYPLIGLVLSRFALQADLLPLIFPLASGFALIGPAAAVVLYEMSRLREMGAPVSWGHALGVVRSPSLSAIVALALILVAIFLLWLGAAQAIYSYTLGPEPPSSIDAFVQDIFTTSAGWAMIVIGVGIGAMFACAVLSISVISFPLLLEHKVGVWIAIRTSVQAVLRNPAPMAAWGLIVASGLVLGSIPLFVGLVIVMPVLGHATWHLYRRVCQNPEAPPANTGD